MRQRVAKICSLKVPCPCERVGRVIKSFRRSPESVLLTVVVVEVEVSRIIGSWSRAREKEHHTGPRHILCLEKLSSSIRG